MFEEQENKRIPIPEPTQFSKKLLEEWFEREIMRSSIKCEEQRVGNYSKSFETWKRNQNILNCFQRILPTKRVGLKILDIGCGDGYHLLVLNTQFQLNDCQLLGIDRGQLDISIANHSAKYSKCANITFEEIEDVEKIDMPDNAFDIILCAEVMEHLPHPEKCVAEIFRLLKPGGSAVIATPNDDNVMIKIGKLLRSLSLMSSENYVPPETDEHISVKSVREWAQILKSTGLKIKKRLRGSLIFGGNKYNKHRILFALMLIVDRILDFIPFTMNYSENLTLQVEK